jgi:TRAP-type C4-dicarboxylate transport system permease small subunit
MGEIGLISIISGGMVVYLSQIWANMTKELTDTIFPTSNISSKYMVLLIITAMIIAVIYFLQTLHPYTQDILDKGSELADTSAEKIRKTIYSKIQ